MSHLPVLSDEEVARSAPPAEEAGFGALATEKGVLPLKAMEVQTRIDGLVAQTTIRQTFVNTLEEPLEATYIFPLPDRAAVTRFRMEVAGRVVEGLLKERAEARREYDQAIQEGRRAAITEEERAGVFTLRVGNLLPGEEAVIHLTLAGPLVYSDGEATFRFPLVVAPRYIPGTPLPGPSVGDGVVPDTDAVPDASRITPPVLLPGFPNPVRLSLSVEVQASGLAAGDFRSSLHAVLVSETDTSRSIRLQPGERLNRDFILRYRLAESSVKTALVLAPDDGDGKEGTFVLTVVPPADESKPRPRDVVFVLDRSGSMGGWKMVAARRALARMVDTLTDQDRFTVCAFDDRMETPPSFQGTGLVPATDGNRFRAVEFLARVEARGGTEMAAPLDAAVATLTSAGREGKEASQRERILVLVTDGQVGNEDQILRNLGQRMQDLRIFTLGIDQAVNVAFLRRLATLGGGLCELVESEDRLDEVMDKVHRRLGSPILTGLHLEPTGVRFDRETIVPGRLPDLFPDVPLILLGRYRNAHRPSFTLQARDAAGKSWSETVPGTTSNNSAIAAIWARGRVRELEDRYVIAPREQARLEKEIVATSLKFSVLSRFTAFIAVDVKEVVNPDGKVHRITQPVEPAAGWAMLGTDRLEAAETMAFYCSAPMPAVPPSPLPSPSMPPQAVARGGGLMRKARAFLRGRAPSLASSAIPDAVDLTAYQKRAADLLRRLQASAGASAADRFRELGILGVQLEALVEDLKSIGAAAATIRPLEELLADLRTLLAASQPTAAGIDAAWSRAEAVLTSFAGGQAAVPPAARREGFWK